jgi:hypothetical protein
MAAYEALGDDEQTAARAAHNEMGGSPDLGHRKHYHQILYLPPMLHVGMDRAGVDQLHLVYLNMFKHVFKYTIHHGLPESKKKLVRDYLIAANFYSYDAASPDEVSPHPASNPPRTRPTQPHWGWVPPRRSPSL